MLPYWLGQIEAILAAPADAVPFGRVATDPERIARIGRTGRLPPASCSTGSTGALADAVAAQATPRRRPRLDERTSTRASAR